MKVITHYTFAFLLFLAVLFSLVFMNVISLLMLRRLNRKEEDVFIDGRTIADYELCYA